ncbi:MAG: hypothetical protein ACXABY_00845 [Candidatus Thorarchaeota archaeon]|jgi:hypothetical protein
MGCEHCGDEREAILVDKIALDYVLSSLLDTGNIWIADNDGKKRCIGCKRRKKKCLATRGHKKSCDLMLLDKAFTL